MCACNVLRDLCKRLIPPPIKLVAVVQYQHMMHFIAPASHQPRSSFQTDSAAFKLALPLSKLLDEAFNVAAGGAREASLPSLLKAVCNSASQEVWPDVR